jgi:hypothetical protein
MNSLHQVQDLRTVCCQAEILFLSVMLNECEASWLRKTRKDSCLPAGRLRLRSE